MLTQCKYSKGSAKKRRKKRNKWKVIDYSERIIASHRIESHRIASHRIASNSITLNRIVSNRFESLRNRNRNEIRIGAKLFNTKHTRRTANKISCQGDIWFHALVMVSGSGCCPLHWHSWGAFYRLLLFLLNIMQQQQHHHLLPLYLTLSTMANRFVCCVASCSKLLATLTLSIHIHL